MKRFFVIRNKLNALLSDWIEEQQHNFFWLSYVVGMVHVHRVAHEVVVVVVVVMAAAWHRFGSAESLCSAKPAKQAARDTLDRPSMTMDDGEATERTDFCRIQLTQQHLQSV